MTDTLIQIARYVSLGALTLLIIQLMYAHFKKNKVLYHRSIRLLVNYGVLFTVCWYTFLSFATITNLPVQITETEEKSLYHLKKWILHQELKASLVLLCSVGILGVFNYWYRNRHEKSSSKNSISTVVFMNIVIIVLTLLLTYFHTYNGLAPEVGR